MQNSPLTAGNQGLHPSPNPCLAAGPDIQKII